MKPLSSTLARAFLETWANTERSKGKRRDDAALAFMVGAAEAIALVNAHLLAEGRDPLDCVPSLNGARWLVQVRGGAGMEQMARDA